MYSVTNFFYKLWTIPNKKKRQALVLLMGEFQQVPSIVIWLEFFQGEGNLKEAEAVVRK